ncbi:MAG TPA: sulfatase-like hydrolase/transferase [Myxococcota bacterium]|nr:sulfatase-like hydrolase/transferase [Myxococcota bacterium]HQK50855.1 sulfatase-like hydrolase/transferase [Myxococcota bacterium]
MDRGRSHVWAVWVAMAAIHLPYRVVRTVALVQGGEWGEVRVPLLLLKMPLFLGMDLAGATIGALVALGLAWPLRRAGREGPARVVEGLTIALLGFYVPVSGFVRLVLGTPLDALALQYLLGGEESSGGLVSEALRDSISLYLTPGRLGVVGASMVLGLAVWGGWGRLGPRVSRRGTGVAAGVGILWMAASGLLAPALSSGRLLGTRVMTWEQERSEVPDLLGSVVRLLPDRWRTPEEEGPLTFRFQAPLDPLPPETPPLAEARSGRSNLLLVVLESVPGRVLQSTGAQDLPVLRSLAARGVSFEAHYTPWPQTFKSFFALLCSEQPWPGDRPESDLRFRDACPDGLISVLRRAGWRTSVFLSGDGRFERLREFLERQRPDVIRDMTDMPGQEGAWRNSWGLDEDVTIRAILQDLASRPVDPVRPFAVIYNLAVGHHPYDFPGFPGQAVGTREDHARAVAYIDGVLGRLLEGLRAAGHGDDTLVVVLSDHGEGFQEHPGGAGHGPRLFEEHVRVPWLLAGPGISPQVTVRQPTTHQDVAPTLASLLGIEAPWTWQGRDLTRDPVPRPVFMAGRLPVSPLAVRHGPWKWIQQYGGDDESLFHLEADPAESRDLRAERPGLAEALRNAALAWRNHGRLLLEQYSEVLSREAPARAP